MREEVLCVAEEAEKRRSKCTYHDLAGGLYHSIPLSTTDSNGNGAANKGIGNPSIGERGGLGFGMHVVDNVRT